MGQLIYFVAGADINSLPAYNIDGLLLNTPDWSDGEKQVSRAKHFIKVSGAKFVMLDSGGFQLLKAEGEGVSLDYNINAPIRQNGKINLTPYHVAKAAAKIKPSIVVALDFPINKLSAKNHQELEFRRKLGFNVTWAIETAKLRKSYCPQVELFIPVQCYTIQQFDLFYDLIGDIEFEGFSMPVRNLAQEEIIMFLIRFYQRGIKKVHLLGTSSFLNIALCAFMARNIFDWVSFDSTTWRVLAEHECYANPHDLFPASLKQKVQIPEAIQPDCPCPWCREKSFEYIKSLPYVEKFVDLMCHNYYATAQATKKLYENAQTLSQLKIFLLKNFPDTEKVEKLCQALAIAEELKDMPVTSWQEILCPRFSNAA